MFQMWNYFNKINFHRDIKKSDGLTPCCKLYRITYRKKHYNEHYDLEINRHK